MSTSIFALNVKYDVRKLDNFSCNIKTFLLLNLFLLKFSNTNFHTLYKKRVSDIKVLFHEN
jgi:hypothetical protein